ncbi:3818_t:CDS:2 [Acaulospora colombiana]|uniref:3818_t:CDS:1 n=1 Tax=Acaulospora colombiana TaxID=27376 RepID=A0ACA9L9H8_9GLOM|nr:3818_t:CDS:2 [Acaulospora colombiana]
MGPALLLSEVIKFLIDNKIHQEVKEALTKYNINDNGDYKELQQCVREIKLNTSEQETNNLTSTVSLSSTSTQTVNISDPKSLTYLIQGLISLGLRHFFLDEDALFVGGKTEGVCRISSADPRLSSVSLYCEYELGTAYYHQLGLHQFVGYPIVLKSPFNLCGTKIVTGLDKSKTKFIDNDNYVIEFDELHSDPSIGTAAGQTSAASQIKTVMTQTKSYVEDKETLTYICFFLLG